MEYKYRQGTEFDVFAKERPKARVIPGSKPRAHFYTPAKTKAWEEHVGVHALDQLRSVRSEGGEFTMPMAECRILAALRFNIRKPVSYSKSVLHATKKPDLDNLVKAILDGLTQAQVIEDDNCITDISSMKRYATDEHPLGVEVELACLPL